MGVLFYRVDPPLPSRIWRCGDPLPEGLEDASQADRERGEVYIDETHVIPQKERPLG